MGARRSRAPRVSLKGLEGDDGAGVDDFGNHLDPVTT